MATEHPNLPDYNPNAPADASAGVFGVPGSYETAKVVYLPVPWEATTSYGGGTVHGPEAILAASAQLDLFDLEILKPYLHGLFWAPEIPGISAMNSDASTRALAIKEAGGVPHDRPELAIELERVNRSSDELNSKVRIETAKILRDGKIPGIIGGEHSVPYGAFQAAAECKGSFGILHFDAHSDTRSAYMGFRHSHASIMRNAAEQIPGITHFVQVGIRDFCEEELEFTRSQGERFEVFYDQVLQSRKMSGTPFSNIAREIIQNLPEQVWVSFDIDGLDPRFCPHTGTPVPGGLDFSEALLILRTLAKSGRKIIGFDLVEVAPPLNGDGAPLEPVQAIDEWDANVAMRLLYKMSAYALASNGVAAWNPLTQDA
jgi:agmatinase